MKFSSRTTKLMLLGGILFLVMVLSSLAYPTSYFEGLVPDKMGGDTAGVEDDEEDDEDDNISQALKESRKAEVA
jgi:hypothetical protein